MIGFTILLIAMTATDPWLVETIPAPAGEIIEAGGLAFLPDGRVAVSTRRGRVWLVDGALDDDPSDAQWTRFADGLWEGLGLDVDGDDLIVLQRGELSRLRDVDHDGLVDDVEVMSQGWGVSDNYHEFAFGLPRDERGGRFVSLNLGFGSPEWWHGQSVEPHRGWILRVSPDGTVEPWACGFRSPCGLGIDVDGRLLATDNQGDWMPSSPIFVVKKGGFHGHPASLRWTEDYGFGDRKPHDREPPNVERVPAAIWIPYEWSRSTGNLVPDTTGGTFGPFVNQLFVAEVTTGRVLRAEIEEVDGVSQGAVWPFLSRVGSVARVAFAPDGSLVCGLTNRGWGGLSPGHGLARVTWQGETPLEMLHMRLVPGGFDIEFTHAIAGVVAPEQVQAESYDYNWWWKYGSPEQRRSAVDITQATLSRDRRILHLEMPELSAGRVVRLKLSDIVDTSGRALRTDEVAYTVNRLPGGPTRTVAREVTPPPLDARTEDESGWLRLTWADPKQLWVGDWRLAKDKLDPSDRTRFTRSSGNDVLVNDVAQEDYVLQASPPMSARVGARIMLPKTGGIAIGLPGNAAIVVRDHAGHGSVEVIDADGHTLAKSKEDAWRGPGQLHQLEFEVSDGQLKEVLLDDMRVLAGIALPAGGHEQWLRVLAGVGPGGIADIRLKPMIDAASQGESLLRGSFVLSGDLGGGLGSEGLSLTGSGRLQLRADSGRDWRIDGRLRFESGASATLVIGGVSIAIAEGRSPSPSTGSIIGHAPLAVRLIPEDTWYELDVTCASEAVSVSINGIKVAASTVIFAPGGVSIELQAGGIDVGSLRIHTLTQ